MNLFPFRCGLLCYPPGHLKDILLILTLCTTSFSKTNNLSRCFNLALSAFPSLQTQFLPALFALSIQFNCPCVVQFHACSEFKSSTNKAKLTLCVHTPWKICRITKINHSYTDMTSSIISQGYYYHKLSSLTLGIVSYKGTMTVKLQGTSFIVRVEII